MHFISLCLFHIHISASLFSPTSSEEFSWCRVHLLSWWSGLLLAQIIDCCNISGKYIQWWHIQRSQQPFSCWSSVFLFLSIHEDFRISTVAACWCRKMGFSMRGSLHQFLLHYGWKFLGEWVPKCCRLHGQPKCQKALHKNKDGVPLHPYFSKPLNFGITSRILSKLLARCKLSSYSITWSSYPNFCYTPVLLLQLPSLVLGVMET